MSDRLGRWRILLIYMLAMPILILVFSALNGWAQFSILPVLGFTALSPIPVVLALVQETFAENRALANGVYMSLSFGLRSVAAVAIGALGDQFGLRMVFTASAVIPLLGLSLLVLLPRDSPSVQPRATEPVGQMTKGQAQDQHSVTEGTSDRDRGTNMS